MPIRPESEEVKQPYPSKGHETDQIAGRSGKRSQGGESPRVQDEPFKKRPRISPASCAIVDKKDAVDTIDDINRHKINHWIQEGSWPKEAGRRNVSIQAVRHLETDGLAKGIQRHEWDNKQAADVSKMVHPLLVRKRSSASLRRQNSALKTASPSDLSREENMGKYSSPGYETELANKGSFMRESDLDITDESKALCQTLLDSDNTLVQDSLFRNDRFKTACRKIRKQNEARVLQDITRLIVPSAESLATCGATGLEHLVESVKKGWNSAIPVTDPSSQPDYSVTFGQSAFTNDQLKKLKPFVGELLSQPTDLSYFMAT